VAAVHIHFDLHACTYGDIHSNKGTPLLTSTPALPEITRAIFALL
jgi:hypothetical protein